ncbi:hypothetical protein KQX54_011083 [Cotesia glomerata]|uniref:Uncharacterized protein n=1 Tax=Cotesia glomerata TaxID=32391 RepID=A0AAV7I8M1_COTGL|nr:hypothetical protein KQX54_011083 [Cotesia glomerata]
MYLLFYMDFYPRSTDFIQLLTKRKYDTTQFYLRGRPMVNPTMQTVSAKEGDALEVAVEFCAEPSYTKLLWLSSESVYVPGGNARDDVRVLEVEVNYPPMSLHSLRFIACSHAFQHYKPLRSPLNFILTFVNLFNSPFKS